MHIMKRGDNQEQTADNQLVVPYNPFLSVRYQTHINMEVVYCVDTVKYLYKYICMRCDVVVFTVQDSSGQEVTMKDVVETFDNMRYISVREPTGESTDTTCILRSPLSKNCTAT